MTVPVVAGGMAASGAAPTPGHMCDSCVRVDCVGGEETATTAPPFGNILKKNHNISHTRFSSSIILDQNETLLLRNNYDFFAQKNTERSSDSCRIPRDWNTGRTWSSTTAHVSRGQQRRKTMARSGINQPRWRCCNWPRGTDCGQRKGIEWGTDCRANVPPHSVRSPQW